MSEQKRCKVCGTVFGRRANERSGEFRYRTTCSKVCRWRSFRITYQTLARERRDSRIQELGPRLCETCGADLRPRRGESIVRFCGRRTCSRICAASQRRKDYTKVCPICGVIYRRGNDESSGGYRKRATCSRECGGEYRRLSRIKGAQRISPYPLRWDEGLREAIRERDSRRCQICRCTRKKGRNLEVHHIDHNKQNIVGGNLITLCAACHRRVHRKRSAIAWVTCFQAFMQHGEPLPSMDKIGSMQILGMSTKDGA
jgi:hypothetical protein